VTAGTDDIIGVEDLVNVDCSRASGTGVQLVSPACAWRCWVGVWLKLLCVRLLGEMGGRASACMRGREGLAEFRRRVRVDVWNPLASRGQDASLYRASQDQLLGQENKYVSFIWIK
jgi:hypothetical protein